MHRLLNTVLDLLPPIDDMLRMSSGTEVGLRTALEALHPLLFPLLRWLFTSSRGLLRKLEDSEVSRLLTSWVPGDHGCGDRHSSLTNSERLI